MKRFFLFFLPLALVLCALSAPTAAAAASDENDGAEVRYAVVNKRNVCLYREPGGVAPLFLLPYTYFVRILGEEDGDWYVQYADDDPPFEAVTGYCLAGELTPVEFVPETPYLDRTVELVYTIDDPGGGASSDILTVSKTVAYYGHIYENNYLYYCVLDGGVLKRVPADEPLEYELNSEYGDYVASLPVSAEAEDGGLSAAAIVAICVACVAAVAVAVLVARGKRPPVHDPDGEF